MSAAVINPPESNIGQDRAEVLSVSPNIGDDLLALAYLRAKAEGLLRAMFWDKAPELVDFLRWCSRPDIVMCGCFVGSNLAGLGWLDNIKTRGGKRIGDVGELYFRQYQGGSITVEFGRKLLDYAFHGLDATVCCGITPAKNLAAVRYLKLMGFTHLPPVPGICSWMGESSPGIISYLERDTWDKRSSSDSDK